MSVSPLVSADWAVERLADPGVRFVEVSLDTEVYDGIHIPGAIKWDRTRDLHDPIRRDIPTSAAFSALLSAAGIGPDTHVVVYGDHGSWIAAWGYRLLRAYGLEQVSLLDGGRRYWTDHHLPVLVSVLPHEATDVELAEPDRSSSVGFAEILARIGDDDLVLIDTRDEAEFAGDSAPPSGSGETAQRPGHIPGAVSIPWQRVLADDATTRPVEALRQLFAGAGVTHDRDVVTYGRSGERSSYTWFVLHELLGYPRVRDYDGGWVEWGSLIGVPISRRLPAGGGS